jgi:hypothetical protein
MVLRLSGPSRDVRGWLNRSKTHRRVVLTGGGVSSGGDVDSGVGYNSLVAGVGQMVTWVDGEALGASERKNGQRFELVGGGGGKVDAQRRLK